MKRIASLCLAIMLLGALLLPAAALDDTTGSFDAAEESAQTTALFDNSYTRFNDYAGTVTEEEEAQLNVKARSGRDELRMDFPVCVFYTRKSETSLSEFADDYYARNKFGCGEDKSGVLLVLDVKNAVFRICCYGEAKTLLGEAQVDALSDRFTADCHDDALTYYDAFDRYYDAAFAMVEDARAHPTTARALSASGMPDWYPEETEGFQDFHGENLPPVVDDAGIFTAEQFETLSEKIAAMNARLGIGYAAFTSNDNYGLLPEEYSSDFLHFNGYGVGDGYGAVVFYLSLDPEDRCWLTTSINSYEPLFNADVTYEIDEMVDSSIRSGAYYEAFLMHADYVEALFSAMSEDLPAWYPAGTRTYDLDRGARSYGEQPRAASVLPIADAAAVLDDTQMESCTETLRTLMQQYGLELVIFTDSVLRAPKAEQYADDFYYYNGCSADGIFLYLVGTDPAQFGVLYYGAGRQYEKLNIAGELRDTIRNGEHAKAIERYTELLTFMLKKDRLPMHTGTAVFCFAVGLIVGLIASSLVLDKMKHAMVITSTVSAGSYLVNGSFRVLSKNHQFLFQTVTSKAKPKETTSSGSSSSGSRGGSTHTSGHSAGGSYSSGGRRF